jgi:hypothetical protein
MLTEDGLILLITRIEGLAVREAEQRAMATRNTRNGALLMEAREEVQQLRKDMRDAEKKIEEWVKYSAYLRGMLKQRKVADEKLPAAPEPLVTDIPF